MAAPISPGPVAPAPDFRSAPLWLARALLLLWAAFWVWFNVASAIGENEGTWGHLLFAGIAVCLAGIGCFLPRIGGVLMLAAAVAAAFAFHNPAALGLLAAPAAVIGVLLLTVKR